MTLTFKTWDVIVCRHNHPCMIVVRPFSLSQGELPHNSNFLVIDGGRQLKDNEHWGLFRCKKCGERTIRDEFGLMIRKQKKPVNQEEEREEAKEGTSHKSREQL